MGIIDGEGRLFGKINIIDFIVLLFGVCFITTMFYVSLKINSKPQPKTTIEIQISEYEKLKTQQTQINNFLNEHRRAKKYFE